MHLWRNKISIEKMNRGKEKQEREIESEKVQEIAPGDVNKRKCTCVVALHCCNQPEITRWCMGRVMEMQMDASRRVVFAKRENDNSEKSRKRVPWVSRSAAVAFNFTDGEYLLVSRVQARPPTQRRNRRDSFNVTNDALIEILRDYQTFAI